MEIWVLFPNLVESPTELGLEKLLIYITSRISNTVRHLGSYTNTEIADIVGNSALGAERRYRHIERQYRHIEGQVFHGVLQVVHNIL